MKIQINDEVLVIAGKDKGKRGRVISVLKKRGKVVVEGVNIITRHLKRNPQNPEAGGRVQKPAPIDVSNVMIWSPTDGRAVRIRYEGRGRNKRRIASKTGSLLTAAGEKKARRAARTGSSTSEE